MTDAIHKDRPVYTVASDENTMALVFDFDGVFTVAIADLDSGNTLACRRYPTLAAAKAYADTFAALPAGGDK